MFNYRMNLIMNAESVDEEELGLAKEGYIELRDMDSFSDEDEDGDHFDEYLDDVEEMCDLCEGEGVVGVDNCGDLSYEEDNIVDFIPCWDCGGSGYVKI